MRPSYPDKQLKQWSITLKYIDIIHCMYCLTNVKTHTIVLYKYSHILTQCNVLLIYNLHDDDLLDRQVQL